MICPHCHRKIPSEAVFCGACGRRVVGWKGTPQGGGGDGGGRDSESRLAASPSDDTRKVRPNSELIRAAGGDPGATRKMSPDSNLLRVVRGESDDTDMLRPTPRLMDESGARNEPEAVRPPPRLHRDPLTSADGYDVDTAFLLEHALHPGRSRLAVLMLADACLLAVGAYLIVSWALLPRSLTHADLAYTSSPGTRGYVDWNDNGQPARIATGPVLAAFVVDHHTAVGDMGPRAPGRPMSGAPSPADAGVGAQSPPLSTMAAPKVDSATVAKAKRLAKIVAARDRFLKDVPQRIRRQNKAIHDCYRQTLRLFKNIKGFVDIEFVVGTSGQVTNARASRNTTRSRTLGSCISGVFLSTVFPRPPGGPVTLRYPFHFAPRKK
jgi:zinc-ribbon domain